MPLRRTERLQISVEEARGQTGPPAPAWAIYAGRARNRAGYEGMTGKLTNDPLRDAVEATRRACLSAALRAWEDAGIQGLCAEGRWEAAVSAIRALDVEALVVKHAADRGPSQ